MNTFGPYSPIYRAGNNYYVSGQVGADPKTKTAAADIESQTHQVMKNLVSVLAGEGLELSDLVKTTIYLADIKDFARVNDIYDSYFKKNLPKPARACVEVSGLPEVADEKLLIEIEAIAYKE